ncbi:MAG: cache domain-containing protein [Candidatus Anammoxibacter sp.]
MVRPIKGKLGIIFLILAILPLFVMRLVVYPITQKTLRDELVNDLARVGDRQIALLKGWLKEREKDAIVIASDPGVIRSMDLMQDVDDEFRETVEHLQFIKEQYGYKGISVIDRNGRVRITTELNLTGKDVSKFDYFKNALSGETFVTKIRPSEVEVENELGQMETGLPTMFVFTPIKDGTDGSNIGVVLLRLDVIEISKIMQGIKLGESGETYLINKEGIMVTESKFAKQLRNDKLINKRTSLELKVVDQLTGELTLAAKRCLDGDSGFNGFGYKDYRGVQVIGYWRWIPEYDMGLIAEIDVEEGFGVLYKLRNSTLIVFAFMGLGIVIIAFAVGKKISVPITALSEAADRIANGDFSQTVEIKTGDELSELADSLNKISGMLKSASNENNDVKS